MCSYFCQLISNAPTTLSEYLFPFCIFQTNWSRVSSQQFTDLQILLQYHQSNPLAGFPDYIVAHGDEANFCLEISRPCTPYRIWPNIGCTVLVLVCWGSISVKYNIVCEEFQLGKRIKGSEFRNSIGYTRDGDGWLISSRNWISQ